MNTNTTRVSRTLLAASLTLAVASFAGCDNEPGKNKSHATVNDPVKVTTTVDPGAKATEHVFSAADSKISFTGAKVTGKHEGKLGDFRGTIKHVDGDPTKSTVSVEIEMASLSADVEKLTNHLKSPDFFDVATYPKSRFVSTSVKVGGEKGASHTVTGNLEMHGVTKSITFPATIKVHGDAIDVDAEFAINRKDFGVAYAGMADDLIKDEILIRMELHAKKAS